MKYDKIISAVFIPVVLAASFVITPFAYANNSSASQNHKPTATGTTSQNFCNRFNSQSQKYKDDLSVKVVNLQNQINNEAQEIKTDRQNSDNALQQDRAKWAQNRQDIYSKLNSKATTDAQKQAVAAFQNAVEAAVTARESALDAARAAFRQGINQIIPQHQADVKQVLAIFQSSIQTAINQASSQCASGTDSATIRAALQTALQNARNTRQAGIQKIDKVGPQIQQLVQARNAAIKQAMQVYQTALQNVVSALKSAFGEGDNGNATSSQGNATSSGQGISLVILVHGGGFIGGSADGKNMQTLEQFFKGEGYTVESLSYELCPSVKWPTPVDDIAKGVNDTIAKYQNQGIKIHNITYVGFSAGSTAGALLLYSDKYPNIPDITRFIGFSGVYSPIATSHVADDSISECNINVSQDLVYSSVAKTHTKALLIEGQADAYDKYPETPQSSAEYLSGILTKDGVYNQVYWATEPNGKCGHGCAIQQVGAGDQQIIDIINNFMKM